MTQKGSDPSAPGFEAGNGATALHAAVEEGHIEVVKMLLKHNVSQRGSMEGATPLILAAMSVGSQYLSFLSPFFCLFRFIEF